MSTKTVRRPNQPFLKSAPPVRKPATSKANRNHSGNEVSKVPLWMRVILPLSFAFLAASLNAVAVSKSILPTRTFAFTQDLPQGTILQAEHVVEIEVGGSLDRSLLLTRESLEGTSEDADLALDQLLSSDTSNPLILSRSVRAGEIVTHPALNGAEGVQPGSKEGEIQLPAELLQAGVWDLPPNERITFSPSSGRTLEAPERLGPFRVGITTRDPKDASRRRSTPTYLRVFYELKADGSIPGYVDELIRAIHGRNKLLHQVSR